MGDYDISFAPDNDYISGLNGKTYMATASPWFFTVSIALPSPIRLLRDFMPALRP
jgi:hypothetical protein